MKMALSVTLVARCWKTPESILSKFKFHVYGKGMEGVVGSYAGTVCPIRPLSTAFASLPNHHSIVKVPLTLDSELLTESLSKNTKE
jgi:hypothetical protein